MNKDDKLIEFDWVVPEIQAPHFSESIKEAGGLLEHSGVSYQPGPDDDYSEASFEPMLLISGAVAGVFIFKQIYKIWKEHKGAGGTIIDARGDKLTIKEKVPSLERKLVVITKDGPSVFQPDQEDEGLSMLKLLLGVRAA